MLSIQAKIGRSVSTIWAPHGAGTLAPFPQDSQTAPRNRPALKQRLPTLPTGAEPDTSREYAESHAQPYLSNATHEAGQRRMMRADLKQTSLAATRTFQFTIPSQAASQTTLKFSILSQPKMGLTFLPRPPPSRPKKRSRAIADIDGEHSCLQKKKRRLRLFLITSRLSPQFSHPATNIVDRGSSKIAVWAKQKALGRNLLRKAAILNRIRRRAVSPREVEEGHGRVLVEQEKEQKQLELARLEFDHGSVDTYTRPVLSQTPSVPPSAAVRTGGHFLVSGSPSTSPSTSRSPSPTPSSPPLREISDDEASEYRSPNEAYALSPPRAHPQRRDYLPLPPSPLGLSNYDAFDADEDIDPYAHLDEEEEEVPSYFFEDEETNDTPFSHPAITTISSSTAQTGNTQALKTPPQAVELDFSALDPGEAVFGDYDQVDEGADAVWPSTFVQEAAPSTSTSSAPDVPTLFATSPSPSKRTDSFALSPNFRPKIPKKSISPNFAPSTVASSTSPNCIVSTSSSSLSSPNFALSSSMSPNFTPFLASASASSTATLSPAFTPSPALTSTSTSSSNPTPSLPPTSVSPNFAPISTSPNFTAEDDAHTHAPTLQLHRRSNSNEVRGNNEQIRGGTTPRRNSDVEQEQERSRKRRQRDLMFARFGS